ncbi:MAG: beta-galactosidase, partial [Phycisphaeraceae bacterium JB051]
MDQAGWPILAGRNGGWGRFPNYYSYKRVEMDGLACLIDTYPHSQIHGSSNAIRIDWDADPSNGNTPLKPTPGMQLEFGVSVYIQPWTHNTLRSHYVRDGTRMVQWRMGPGFVPDEIKTIEDIRKVKDYSWQAQRGPRIGYRVGDVPDHDPTGKPVFEAFSALADQVHASMQGSQIACWFDLKLAVHFTENANSATCQAFIKPTDQQAWESVGESWAITWDDGDKDANNPANWNALILDMPYAQWSTKGYGQPEEHMFDRYRQFFVKIQLSNQQQAVKRAELMRFDRQATACRMLMPKYVFADQPIAVQLQVVNASGDNLHGDLLLKAQDSEQLLEKDWTLAPDKQWQTLRRFAPAIDLSVMTFELLIRKADGKHQLLAKESCDIINRNLPGPTENVLHNSGFEKTGKYNGSKMYRGYERTYSYAKRGNKRLYTQLPVQSWWALGDNAEGVTVDATQKHSGEQSLMIEASEKPITVVSAPGNWLPAGDVTLTAWIRSEQADATLQLNLLTSDDQILPRRVTVVEKQNLPATSDWMRVTVRAKIDRPMQALPGLKVLKGKVWFDDLMVQSSSDATDYAAIPTEWIALQIVGQSNDSVPIWSDGETTKRQLILSSLTPEHLRGHVKISLGTWDNLATQPLGRVALSELHSQKKVSIDFETSQLKPNAYVITTDVHLDDGRVIKGAGQFLPRLKIGGSASSTQVLSQMVMRFAIAPSYKPAELFGVGNGMLDQHGDHFSGYRFSDYKWAGQLDYICDRGRYTTQKGFLIAAGGMPTHRMEWRRLDIDPTRNREIQNPAKGGRLDIWHPEGRKVFLDQAESIGKENGENPQIASYQMANEQPFYGKDGLCPTLYADAAFRNWCQQLHGDLKTLNQRWGTDYTTWQQVEQPLSSKLLELVQSQDKLNGADAMAWTEVYGKMSKPVQAMIQSSPGRGM